MRSSRLPSPSEATNSISAPVTLRTHVQAKPARLLAVQRPRPCPGRKRPRWSPRPRDAFAGPTAPPSACGEDILAENLVDLRERLRRSAPSRCACGVRRSTRGIAVSASAARPPAAMPLPSSSPTHPSSPPGKKMSCWEPGTDPEGEPDDRGLAEVHSVTARRSSFRAKRGLRSSRAGTTPPRAPGSPGRAPAPWATASGPGRRAPM